MNGGEPHGLWDHQGRVGPVNPGVGIAPNCSWPAFFPCELCPAGSNQWTVQTSELWERRVYLAKYLNVQAS